MDQETFSREMLIAQCTMLINSVNELGSMGTALPQPSKEDMNVMPIDALLSLRRDLRDLMRTLGGVKGRG